MENEAEEDWKNGCYRDSLGDFLKHAIDQWKHDREVSWSSGGPAEEIEVIIEELHTEEALQRQDLFDRIEELAQAIFESCLNIGDSKHLDDLGHDLTDYFFCREFIKHTQDSLGPRLAEMIITNLTDAANRMVNLGEVVLWALEQFTLTESLKKFLRKAIWSYVWGFDALCIAFCRSAIEDVLGRWVRDLYEKRGEIFDEYRNSLSEYIKLAEQEDLLDNKYIRYANDIRWRANQILHSDAGLTQWTQDTISKTARVIAVIETGRDPFGIYF